jgi:hypothetical protein
LVADSHRILARWRNHFSQLLNANGVNNFRRTDLHTAEILVPDPSVLEFELAIENLKGHQSPGTDQISPELINARGRAIHSEIHKFLIFYLE